MKPTRTCVLAFLLAIAQLDAAQSNLTLEEAGRQFSSGHFKEAASIYSALILVAPDLAGAHAGLIRAYLEANNIAGAILAVREGLRVLPDSGPVLSAAGDVQFRIGQFSQALILYQNALSADPGFGRAWWGVGRVELALSMRKSAREHFTKAYALAPQDPDIVRSWAYTRESPRLIADGLESYVALAGYREPDYLERVRKDVLVRRELNDRRGCTVVSPIRSQLKMREVSQSQSPAGLVSPTFHVDISVGSAKPERFGLSISDAITLSPAYARKAGVSRIHDPANSSDKRYLAIAKRIAIGGIELENCVVNVQEPGGPSRNKPTGTFGLELLSDFLMTLDFGKRTISFDPLSSRPADEYWADRDAGVDRSGFMPFWRISGQPGIPVRVNSSEPLLFLLGLGGNASAIALPLAKNLGIAEPRSMSTIYLRPCGLHPCVSLEIGGHVVKAELITDDFSKRSQGFGTEIEGVLGYNVLSQFVVTMDLRNGFVRFDKLP